MLYSARSEDFKSKLGQERAVATCKLLGLDALVGIGGDGTFRGLLSLAQQGLSVIGIPVPLTTILLVPHIPLATILLAILRWSPSTSFVIPCSPTSAARW